MKPQNPMKRSYILLCKTKKTNPNFKSSFSGAFDHIMWYIVWTVWPSDEHKSDVWSDETTHVTTEPTPICWWRPCDMFCCFFFWQDSRKTEIEKGEDDTQQWTTGYPGRSHHGGPTVWSPRTLRKERAGKWTLSWDCSRLWPHTWSITRSREDAWVCIWWMFTQRKIITHNSATIRPTRHKKLNRWRITQVMTNYERQNLCSRGRLLILAANESTMRWQKKRETKWGGGEITRRGAGSGRWHQSDQFERDVKHRRYN